MNEYNTEDVKRLIRAAIKLNLSIDVSSQYPSVIPQMNELESAIANLIGKENSRRKTWESKRPKIIDVIKEEIQNAVKEYSKWNTGNIKEARLESQKNNIINSVISIDDAIKMKNKGKYDGADWYYYMGLLVATSTPERGAKYFGGIVINNKTWLVPAEFVKTHNVKNATYPAFYKN